MNGFSRLSIFTAMAMLFFSPIILAVPQLNLELLDDALASDRLVAMVQPNFLNKPNVPVEDLCSVGTLGRIISLAESGDGRY
ncbi:MAG: hypothetical protein HRU20_12050, partial [Pseudomonadales bacterium]|nr:hypothetical protein [Pseudomonadales bacterium]